MTLTLEIDRSALQAAKEEGILCEDKHNETNSKRGDVVILESPTEKCLAVVVKKKWNYMLIEL
jgi:hypothetical protein